MTGNYSPPPNQMNQSNEPQQGPPSETPPGQAQGRPPGEGRPPTGPPQRQGQQSGPSQQYGQEGSLGQYGQQRPPEGQPGQMTPPAQGSQYGPQGQQQPGGQQSQPPQGQQFQGGQQFQSSQQPQGGVPPQQWHQPPQQQYVAPPSPQQMGPQGQQGGAQSARPPRGTGRALQAITVDELVQTDVVTAEQDASLNELADLMAEEDVGCVVIVEDQKPQGIVTDRKLALTLRSSDEQEATTARDLLHGDLITGSEDMNVFEALQRLEEASIRRLPIVSEEGELTGIVTLDDILVLLGSELSNAAEIIKAQSPRL